MSRRKVLSPDEIEQARQLKNVELLSNRKIALIFEVGKTTIWENVYATHRRIRTQSPRVKYIRCNKCGILYNVKIQDTNVRIGCQCTGCLIKTLKKKNYNSLQIAEVMNIDLELVNKYWII
jgi:uncharacterized paraquat-inducible protein A